MRQIFTLLVVIGLLVGVLGGGVVSKNRVSLVAPVHAQNGCSVSSVRGAFGFYRIGSTAVGPLGAVGIATFDGAGNSTAIQTIRKNGVTTSDLFTDPPQIGPYELDPNCAGRFLLPDGTVFAHFVVVDGGKELFIISLSSGNTVTGVMRKMQED